MQLSISSIFISINSYSIDADYQYLKLAGTLYQSRIQQCIIMNGSYYSTRKGTVVMEIAKQDVFYEVI